MKTRLLLVIPTLDRSGAEKQCVLLATHLPSDRFDVHVAALTRTGPLAADLAAAGVPLTLIGKRGKVDPFAYGRLRRLIRCLQPDIVHTWLFAANAYGRVAAVECNVPRIIGSERCVDPWKSSLHFRIDRYLAAKSERMTTNSLGVVDFYVRHGIPADKFVVIPNAVLVPPNSTRTRCDLDASLELCPLTPVNDEPYAPVTNPNFQSPQRPLLLGIAARLWPQKRVHEMIWVFESLRFTGVDFHALIFGDGPERDDLLRYRDDKRLSDCVHFLGHRNDLSQFMPHLDLLLCPSAYEGQSNTILEAMACGIPVIASDIPGNDELVVRDVTGVLVPEYGDDFRKRRSMFVREIIRLYEDLPRRQMLGEAARERIATHFSLNDMIGRHIALYRPNDENGNSR